VSHAVAEMARPPVDLTELRTLAMFEEHAAAVLPLDVFASASGGPSVATLERNRQALRHLAIEQRVLMNVKTVDTRAYFVGMTLPSPIIVSPMDGLPRFHPEGDLALARGATRHGGMTVVAGGCTWPLETIGAAATGPLMFQLDWLGDRDWVSEKLQRVYAGGFKAVCLAVDADTQAGLTWDDVDWVRAQLALPFGLKGIMTAPDARLALDRGVDFIWVSNHGGRRLDDGRATIDALLEIAQVVRGRVPLIVDSGFRRGTDAMKALALGATLVAFGRTVLWGLAAAGADGVQQVLQLLHDELVINMKLAGRTVTSELPPDIIRRVDSAGFAQPIRLPGA